MDKFTIYGAQKGERGESFQGELWVRQGFQGELMDKLPCLSQEEEAGWFI